MKVAKLLPASIADDAPMIRALLTIEAQRAGLAISPDATVTTRVLVAQDWVPEEWRSGQLLLAEVDLQATGSGS